MPRGHTEHAQIPAREGAGMCSIHVSSTHTHLQSMGKGLRRSVESAARHTGWSTDLALGTASKWHFFAFLEAETPYPTPEYHNLARTGWGLSPGLAESRQETHESPTITYHER